MNTERVRFVSIGPALEILGMTTQQFMECYAPEIQAYETTTGRTQYLLDDIMDIANRLYPNIANASHGEALPCSPAGPIARENVLFGPVSAEECDASRRDAVRQLWGR